MARIGKLTQKAMIRTFVALPLNDEIRYRLDALADTLPIPEHALKRPRMDQLHVTLTFIGNTSVRDIGGIGQDIHSIAERYTEIPLVIQGIGAFPSIKKPRVLAAMVKPTDDLVMLHDEIEAHLFEEYGISIEKRSYRPHVTIGRIKGNRYLDIFERWLNRHGDHYVGECLCDTVVLFQSDRRRTGPVYMELASARLGEMM